MESASVAAGGEAGPVVETGEKGLKKDAIGFVDGLCIGLASTAPAYSLAAVIGSIVVAVGIHAPGVLLLSFVPMFFIAAAFFYMNRVDTDCGTTFSWVTRALGPYAGWIGGWAICTTGILVIGSLADVSALFLFDLLELNDLRKSDLANVVLAVAIIAVMTTICVIGTEISAHLQRFLTFFQVGGAAPVRGRRPGQGRRRRRRGALDRSRAELALAVRGRVLGAAHRGAARRCSSTGAGRAPSTSPRSRGTRAAGPGSRAWRAR